MVRRGLFINWADNSIKGHQYTKRINESFIEELDTSGLTQIFDFPTKGNNMLDILATNRPTLLNKCIQPLV